MTMFVHALIIGCVAGLRPMVALAVVSLAANAGWLLLQALPALLEGSATACMLVVLAGAEMLGDRAADQRSGRQPAQFGLRLISGGLCGAAIGGSEGRLWGGALGGIVGALCGTLGGGDLRSWLSSLLKRRSSAAVTENAVVIGAAALVMAALT